MESGASETTELERTNKGVSRLLGLRGETGNNRWKCSCYSTVFGVNSHALVNFHRLWFTEKGAVSGFPAYAELSTGGWARTNYSAASRSPSPSEIRASHSQPVFFLQSINRVKTRYVGLGQFQSLVLGASPFNRESLNESLARRISALSLTDGMRW